MRVCWECFLCCSSSVSFCFVVSNSVEAVSSEEIHGGHAVAK